MNSRLLLIDGHSLLYRAWHALPKTLTTSEGELTNAVYGFTRMVLATLKKFNPQYVAISFDLPQPTFRSLEFAPYKAQRPETPDGFKPQVKRAHEVAEALGIPVFEVEGYEADDVIGTLASQASLKSKIKNQKSKIETVIISDDRDLLQLAGNGVKVYAPKKDELLDRKRVGEELGIPPKYIPDFKALAGDPSDNIPGVKGIGKKTAKKLIQRFGSLEGIYEHLGDIDPKLRKSLAEEAEQATLSKKLARVVTDVPLTLDLEKCQRKEWDKNKKRVRKLFEKLEFRSLLKELEKEEEQKRLL